MFDRVLSSLVRRETTRALDGKGVSDIEVVVDAPGICSCGSRQLELKANYPWERVPTAFIIRACPACKRVEWQDPQNPDVTGGFSLEPYLRRRYGVLALFLILLALRRRRKGAK